MRSGRLLTSRSTATRSFSRRFASPCFTRSRQARGASGVRFRPRDSPVRATTATRSGTPRRSCCPCSLTRGRAPSRMRCDGATRRSTWPASARGRWGFAARRFRGARSPARSAPATGRRARRRSTSTPRSRTPLDRYQLITQDETFEREAGVELLVETARLWRSLGHHDAAGQFRIDGVTGPDEYSAIADNNVYTNLMAARNLRAAADAVERHPDVAKQLAVDDEEAASWRDAATTMFIPYDESLARPPSSGRLHPTRHMGLRLDPARELSPATALPILRPLPQAGRQAGGPGDGAVLRRRGVHRRGEGAGLRLLRTVDSPRLIAVGLHTSDRCRRSRARRAGLRLFRRSRAARPRRPRTQHPRRRPYRLARGDVHRRARRLRRPSRPQRDAQLHAPPPAGADPGRVQPPLSQDGTAENRSRADPGHVHAADGRSARHRAPRTARQGPRPPRPVPDPLRAGTRATQAAARSRARTQTIPADHHRRLSRDAAHRCGPAKAGAQAEHPQPWRPGIPPTRA